MTFAGLSLARRVLRAFAGARAAVLPSLWENLPHAAVEALAVGAPVVATAVGGVPEVIHDDENGLLVPPGDVAALAAALRRMLADDELHDRLAAGRQAVGCRDRPRARLHAARADPARGGRLMAPRVLFVGRGRITLPLPAWLAKKWDALSDVFDLRVLNAGSGGGDPRFHLLPDAAPLFYSRLVPELARELRSYRPDVLVAADPYVGAAALAARSLARRRPR